MEQKADSSYPSAPFENLKKNDLEQRLEKKLNDVKCFTNSNINLKELITYLKDKNKYQKRDIEIIQL